MSDLYLHCQKAINRQDSFVGISFTANDYEIIFPYGYDIESLKKHEDGYVRQEIHKLIKTIDITRRHYPNLISNYYAEENCSVFESMFLLIEDYLKNGLIKDSEESDSLIGKGKINWKKTIHSKPIVDTKHIFFPNIFHRSIKHFDSLLTRLEVSCLVLAQKTVGFLFDDFHLPQETIDNPVDFIPNLKQRYSKTYIDSDKRILEAMISILENKQSNNNLISKDIGTYSYFAVWEYMLRYIYGNQNESDFYPQGCYVIDGKSYDDTNLRPDIIYYDSDNNCYYVLDAKYYKYGETKNVDDLPSTSSISKQFIYGKRIMDKCVSEGKKPKILSAFILPCSHASSMNIGYGCLKNDVEANTYPFSKIGIVLKNTKEVTDDFLGGVKRKDIFDIIDK